MPSDATILEYARSLIADSSHFTTRNFAHNKTGEPVHSCSSDATSWCASGALLRASFKHQIRLDDQFFRMEDLLHKAAMSLFNTSPVDVNDTLGHKAILKMYDLAITLSRSEVGNIA